MNTPTTIATPAAAIVSGRNYRVVDPGALTMAKRILLRHGSCEAVVALDDATNTAEAISLTDGERQALDIVITTFPMFSSKQDVLDNLLSLKAKLEFEDATILLPKEHP